MHTQSTGLLAKAHSPLIANIPSDVALTAPGALKVIRRNGAVTAYDDSKIKIAITKAFLAVEGGTAAASNRIHQTVDQLTRKITDRCKHLGQGNAIVAIEDIQDQVELALMRSSEYKVARAYVLYREERSRIRATDKAAAMADAGSLQGTMEHHPGIRIKDAEGQLQALNLTRLKETIARACHDLEFVEAQLVLDGTVKNLYDGVLSSDVATALVITARTLIEQEPNYSKVAARLLLASLRSEALSFLGITYQQESPAEHWALVLECYIKKGVELALLSPKLLKFDLKQLGYALKPERDLQFAYLGLQTLYDRYLIHKEEVRFELPQVFFMRVAMGLAVDEAQPNEAAIEFYQLLSSFDFMSSTPTLFNSGTLRPQLSSCYLTTVADDLEGIYSAIKDNALLSKWAGGLGNDWTPVRGLGAYIKGTNGKSQGVVPFLKVANDTAVAVNQGGKRKGAVCAYLEIWHLDIEEFLELRKNTGDERRRTHDMNTAVWVPDLFVKRIFANQDWTLFSPNETPDLHDLYGQDFEQRYAEYEQMAARGELRCTKVLPAKQLWRKMLSMLFETGHPWVTFKDPCNLRSPQSHNGCVHSSNLCTEITLNTSADEIAVCNLGSVNLAQHVSATGLDQQKLKKTVKTALRMLDNVIDINYYSVPQARNSNLKHRPVGMGMMGFQDVLYIQGIAYGSEQAVTFADQSMELLSYYAIQSSIELAQERGRYESYAGSLWSQGILPIDSIERLAENREKGMLKMDRSQSLDWAALRKQLAQHGMRNSNVMAIAPTATISNICGVTQSIEPTYQNLYVKSNLSGEFTMANPYLVKQLKLHGLWDNVMVNDLKYFDGSVKDINRVPEEIKQIFATAFEVDPKWLVEAASRRQKWIDQSQSLNLYVSEASGPKLDVLYRMCWLLGLKTTYYLRTKAATSTEKSTLYDGALNAVQSTAPNICAIDDPDCEACQ